MSERYKGETAINRFSFRSLFSGLVPFFIMAHLAHHLVTALPVPLLPFIRDEFALDYTRAGLVISAFGIVYGASQLPAGWLADRIGPRTLITASICGVAVTGLLSGLSTTYLMLIVFLILMGILGGGYHPASTTMLATVVEPKKRGRAMGFHMIGGAVSYFLAPLAAAGIADIWGWRGSFITLAVPTFIFGIILSILLKRRAPPEKAKAPTAGNHVRSPFLPGRLRYLTTIIFLSTFTQAVIVSVVAFLPLFLVDQSGISKGAAAASVALIYSAGLWAGPAGGYISDRLGRLSIILTVCFMSGPIIYLLNLVPYGAGINALLIIIGAAMYVNTTVSQAYIIDRTTERNRSTILGIYFFGSMEGSGVITPLIGYLLDKVDFYYGFTVVGAVLLAVTLISSAVLWMLRK